MLDKSDQYFVNSRFISKCSIRCSNTHHIIIKYSYLFFTAGLVLLLLVVVLLVQLFSCCSYIVANFIFVSAYLLMPNISVV